MRNNMTHVSYHVVVVALSAAMVLSFPVAVRFIAGKVLVYWALLENAELFHNAAEVGAAVALIFVLNALVKDWRLRKHARMAKNAGLVAVAPADAFFTGRWLKRLKEGRGVGRDIMIIGATGFRTFAEPSGHLHKVVRSCREARIMLLDPRGEGMRARARSLSDSEITPETLREQVLKSIAYLKGLKSRQKNIRLKLYPEVPLVKLCILGDCLCLQHYPTGLNVRKTQEYVFRHEHGDNLFSLFHAYFSERWLDPDIPEYDLEQDELVYRDRDGSETRRTMFGEDVSGLKSCFPGNGRPDPACPRYQRETAAPCAARKPREHAAPFVRVP